MARSDGAGLLRAGLALVGAFLAAAGAAAAAEPLPGADATYVGTAACAGCHEAAYRDWRGSHHDLAMQQPTPETVLGDFDDARFEHFGAVTEFTQRDGRYFVRTEGPAGTPETYEVAWVFGVYPLQQYLLPLEDGRLQALSVAWDSRPAAEGGQRWYHLYPDEAITAGDPLHWTGPYQNWNTRCAECHSTDVEKHYDAAARRFATTFFEEDVGCEACHGPGSRHAAAAGQDALEGLPAAGFPVDLAARGAWAFAGDEPIARRRDAMPGMHQVDTCARCHARRSTLGTYRHGQPLADTHRLALLGAPLYHADGQILDEVYVYGSFVQSAMHRAGVVCSNCHEPHSNRLRAPGNGVCAQCHKASVFDTPDHHRHAGTGPGTQCVDCHMPARTYMGVDDRRDHSMRIPRPDLSLMAGTPNACTDCHADRSDTWALDALRKWGIEFHGTSAHPAVALAAVERGDARGAARLADLATDPDAAAIWRATALARSAAVGNRRAIDTAVDLLSASDPLLRATAARALEPVPPAQRYRLLAPLIDDPATDVRMAVARQLAPVPLDRLAPPERERLLLLFDEYRAVQREHADMPSINVQLGLFHQARGDRPAAEAAYREALRINPQLIAASLNLADLLRAGGREAEAREQLEEALAVAPDNGDVMHALGLLEIRSGDADAALEWLRRAASLPAAAPRHRYVYAIALHDTGDRDAALETLRDLHRRLPAHEPALRALVDYNVEAGDRAAARRYAAALVELAPDNPQYRRLSASLR